MEHNGSVFALVVQAVQLLDIYSTFFRYFIWVMFTLTLSFSSVTPLLLEGKVLSTCISYLNHLWFSK
jgi:hypothetical protein